MNLLRGWGAEVFFPSFEFLFESSEFFFPNEERGANRLSFLELRNDLLESFLVGPKGAESEGDRTQVFSRIES
jgi:hypothetical protein